MGLGKFHYRNCRVRESLKLIGMCSFGMSKLSNMMSSEQNLEDRARSKSELQQNLHDSSQILLCQETIEESVTSKLPTTSEVKETGDVLIIEQGKSHPLVTTVLSHTITPKIEPQLETPTDDATNHTTLARLHMHAGGIVPWQFPSPALDLFMTDFKCCDRFLYGKYDKPYVLTACSVCGYVSSMHQMRYPKIPRGKIIITDDLPRKCWSLLLPNPLPRS